MGDVVASRFVGLAMSMNDDIAKVPCRRVVQSDGNLGGYTGGGPEKKAALLRAEGVTVRDGKVRDLDQRLFTDFISEFPLRRLRTRQRQLKSLVRIPRTDIDLRHVAGIDVAYSGERAYAVAAVFDCESGDLVDQIVREGTASFPYIPTYLAFRELPLVSSLVTDLPEGTVLMYDGNGILHPEGMGIATHAGVAFHMPTIGVAKSLLCGTRGRPIGACVVPISLGGRTVGFELTGRRSSKPVYASVGYGIGPRQTLEVVKKFMKHRVPEPTRMAHILADEVRRGTSHK